MPNRTLLELNTQTSPFSLHSCGQKGLGRLIEEEIALEPEEISSKKVWSIFKPQRQLSAPTIALGEVASDSLAIRQGATLLKVTLQRYSIGIDKANITFHVALDPEAISDILEAGKLKVSVDFDIKINLEGRKQIVKEYTAIIYCTPEPIKSPHVESKSLDVVHAHSIKDIGYLYFSYPTNLEYDGTIKITACLCSLKRNGAELALDKLTFTSLQCDGIITQHYNLESQKLEVDGLKNDKVRVTLSLNLEDQVLTPNPVDKDSYEIQIKYEYSYNQLDIPPRTETRNFSFQVKADNSRPALYVTCQQWKGGIENLLLLKPGERLDALKREITLAKSRLATINEVSAVNESISFASLKLKNIASDAPDIEPCTFFPEGCTYSVTLMNQKQEEIKHCDFLKIAQGCSLSDVFSLGDATNCSWSDILRQQNQLNGQECIELFLKLNSNLIEQIDRTLFPLELGMKFNVKCELHLKYQEGTDIQAKEVSLVFTIPMQPDFGDNWLCLDYGTSAIVAYYGDSILALNTEKKRFLEEKGLFTEEKDLMSDVNSPLLSSDLLFLHDTQQEEWELDSPYFLSPTKTMLEDANLSNNLLPCLKIMVGREKLINYQNYFHIRFKDQGKETVLGALEKPLLNRSPLIKIDYIFQNAYQFLFKNYILPLTKQENRTISKLVVTVPNTYRPSDTKKVIDTAKKTFEWLRDDENILVLSESEAAICYYYTNRNTLLPPASLKEHESLFRGAGEHILVYDMGAGTLDISYCKVTATEIDIIGNIGCYYAGNILDYAFAFDVIDEYLENNHAALNDDQIKFLQQLVALDIKEEDKMESIELYRKKYKDYIRTIKTMPSQYENMKFELPTPLFAQSANTLYANPELLEYSHWRKGKEIELYNFACNHLLLEAFFSTLGFTKEKRVPIDVLMFTGRASQLTGLADKIISNINTKWRKQSGRKYNVISLTGDQRKTVVAEGALNYANIKYQRMEGVTFVRNKIYARYGVMYNNGGDWVFEEILGPNSTIKPQQNILYDNTIKINNTQRGAIHIVRTYDKKPEIVWKAVQQDNPSLKTENDSLYQAVNYTTVLYTQQPNFDPNMNQDLAIRLQITNNMDLLISITDCNLGTAIDIMVGACVSEEKNSNISFKKSIWPSLEQ